MSSDLARGRTLDDAPGVIGVTPREYPPLPDSIASDPHSGRLDPRAWFADASRPLEIEIGCGKGSFILEQSGAEPGVNYLGIEWTREYCLYTADRLRRAGRRNVRMLHADGSDFLRWRVPDGIVRVIHLYFSDPWPKTKHHKNRVIQERFLRECARVLVPAGELRVVTDHDELWAWDMERFAPVSGSGGPFELLPFTPPAWVGEGCVVGTNYEKKKCVAAGNKPPHAAVLRKRG
jgi:tRNA (guanine-N7-)-methyltransferase